MKDLKTTSKVFIREIQEQLNDLPDGSRKEQVIQLLAAYEKNIDKLIKIQKSLHRKQEGSNGQKQALWNIEVCKQKKEDHEYQLRAIIRNARLYGY